MYKVVIPEDISDAGKDYLKKCGYELIIGNGDTSIKYLKELVKDADALLVRNASFPEEVIASAPNLKVISRHGVGLDQIDVDFCTKNGIFVTNTPTANGLAVAEHTIGFLIAITHQFIPCDRAVREGNWRFRYQVDTFNLSEKTLGLVGYGSIAKKVAKIATMGLNMKVIACRNSNRRDDVIEGVEIVESIEEVFERSDFVSLHVPAKLDTKGLVDISLMKKMKNTSYLINTSRGAVIVEKDLYKALKEGIIKGAALDVLEKEPPEDDNPLFELDNVMFTPHCATHTKETKDLMGLHAAFGIHSVLSGGKPQWAVNTPRT